jgi:dTDP-4-dehydrorhamnose 3,5-epimerase
LRTRFLLIFHLFHNEFVEVGLSEQAIFCYKQSTYYNRAIQFTLVWNDPKLDIWWPIKYPILSQRDLGIG